MARNQRTRRNYGFPGRPAPVQNDGRVTCRSTSRFPDGNGSEASSDNRTQRNGARTALTGGKGRQRKKYSRTQSWSYCWTCSANGATTSTLSPVSSEHSRTAADSGDSFDSTFPPGNSQRSASGESGPLVPTSTDPPNSTTAIAIGVASLQASVIRYSYFVLQLCALRISSTRRPGDPIALYPPSTCITSPVIPSEKSDRRKAPVRPTSSCVMLRPKGAIC